MNGPQSYEKVYIYIMGISNMGLLRRMAYRRRFRKLYEHPRKGLETAIEENIKELHVRENADIVWLDQRTKRELYLLGILGIAFFLIMTGIIPI